jgi:hypothetical protein
MLFLLLPTTEAGYCEDSEGNMRELLQRGKGAF